MKKIDELKEKVYFQLVGEDLLEEANEAGIDIKNITESDLEFVADKMSDGLDWSNACHEAWFIWKERKDKGEL